MTKFVSRPKRFDARSLEAVGVTLTDTTRLVCNQCKACWSPQIRAGGKLPRRYWQCPTGCNVK